MESPLLKPLDNIFSPFSVPTMVTRDIHEKSGVTKRQREKWVNERTRSESYSEDNFVLAL